MVAHNEVGKQINEARQKKQEDEVELIKRQTVKKNQTQLEMLKKAQECLEKNEHEAGLCCFRLATSDHALGTDACPLPMDHDYCCFKLEAVRGKDKFEDAQESVAVEEPQVPDVKPHNPAGFKMCKRLMCIYEKKDKKIMLTFDHEKLVTVDLSMNIYLMNEYALYCTKTPAYSAKHTHFLELKKKIQRETAKWIVNAGDLTRYINWIVSQWPSVPSVQNCLLGIGSNTRQMELNHFLSVLNDTLEHAENEIQKKDADYDAGLETLEQLLFHTIKHAGDTEAIISRYKQFERDHTEAHMHDYIREHTIDKVLAEILKIRDAYLEKTYPKLLNLLQELLQDETISKNEPASPPQPMTGFVRRCVEPEKSVDADGEGKEFADIVLDFAFDGWNLIKRRADYVNVMIAVYTIGFLAVIAMCNPMLLHLVGFAIVVVIGYLYNRSI